jgi:hypothetical protein
MCNVASYHIKQAMNPSLALVENDDLKRWLPVDDESLVRTTSIAVGMVELELLLAHYNVSEAWVEAAKVARAMGMVSAADSTKHVKAALGLLEKAGSATLVVQQLELDMPSDIARRPCILYANRT